VLKLCYHSLKFPEVSRTFCKFHQEFPRNSIQFPLQIIRQTPSTSTQSIRNSFALLKSIFHHGKFASTFQTSLQTFSLLVCLFYSIELMLLFCLPTRFSEGWQKQLKIFQTTNVITANNFFPATKHHHHPPFHPPTHSGARENRIAK
jgi:hypothetical protein